MLLFIGFLEERADIFSLPTTMKENLHCSNAWLKTMMDIISCMFAFIHVKFIVYMDFVSFKWFCHVLCRSALRSFKRRVIYSNVGYDRILHIYYMFLLIIYAFNFPVAYIFIWFLLFLILKKLRESFETITGVSHDQVAFFKTFHGTTEIVQGRLSTVASPG